MMILRLIRQPLLAVAVHSIINGPAYREAPQTVRGILMMVGRGLRHPAIALSGSGCKIRRPLLLRSPSSAELHLVMEAMLLTHFCTNQCHLLMEMAMSPPF